MQLIVVKFSRNVLIFWNMKVYYHASKRTPLDPVWRLGLLRSLPLRFSNKTFVHMYCFSYAFNMSYQLHPI
jgi:hypothetical protein